MQIEAFKNKLKTTPQDIMFSETMAVIEAHYTYTPKAFQNGSIENEAGENAGSCKLFAFAQVEGLSKEETLACFGPYYFEEVLKDPNGEGHQNIRNFIKTGFEGLHFKSFPLEKK